MDSDANSLTRTAQQIFVEVLSEGRGKRGSQLIALRMRKWRTLNQVNIFFPGKVTIVRKKII